MHFPRYFNLEKSVESALRVIAISSLIATGDEKTNPVQ